MTDKEFNATEKRIKKLIAKWYAPVGWGWWRTDFNYSRDYCSDERLCAAETKADFKYSHADITFYMPIISNMSDDELEHTFVHELCHITASTYPDFEDNSASVGRFERTVDDFARHIIWASKHVGNK